MDNFFDRDKARVVFNAFNVKAQLGITNRIKYAVANSIIGCCGVITPSSICESVESHLATQLDIDHEPTHLHGSWHCSPEEMYAFISMMNDSFDHPYYAPWSFIELGAGWAPWCLNAMRYLMIHRGVFDESKLYPWSFIAVEAMKSHCYGILQHAAINHLGLQPNLLMVRHAAVVTIEAARKGAYAYFPSSEKPSSDWGQRVSLTNNLGDAVQTYSLENCLNVAVGQRPAWIVHSDIQGDELAIFTESGIRDTLQKRVANVIIGTHSDICHHDLFNHFSSLHWELVVARNPVFNDHAQEDGVLAFRNPSFIQPKRVVK